MNAILAVGFGFLASVCLAAWVEPTVADWVIRLLKARAAAKRASRDAYRAAYRASMEES